MSTCVTRALALVLLLTLFVSTVAAATVEKLSIEEMAQSATTIVRGRVTGCTGETRASGIYTRCSVAVSETWKGKSASSIEFLNPGGRVHGLMQVVSGTPQFLGGQEYVLFLWAGRSGVNQVIGLSQGAFDLAFDASGKPVVKRGAATAAMIDKNGAATADTPVQMSVGELKQRVNAALAGGAK